MWHGGAAKLKPRPLPERVVHHCSAMGAGSIKRAYGSGCSGNATALADAGLGSAVSPHAL